MLQIGYMDSPLGRLTLAAAGGCLAGLWLPGQKYYMAGAGEYVPGEDAAPLPLARVWLEAYFAGERPCPNELPLAPRGTAFQRRVWQALLEIPYGQTTTYGAMAERLGASPRVVGGAVGRNPISIVIPCHRVLGAGGALTGYAGGLEKKKWLLAHEGIDSGGKMW